MSEQLESLNLNDLKLMAQIIKVVSARGAIQPDEMAAVGGLFTKLVAFIKAAEPPEETADSALPNNATQPEGI